MRPCCSSLPAPAPAVDPAHAIQLQAVEDWVGNAEGGLSDLGTQVKAMSATKDPNKHPQFDLGKGMDLVHQFNKGGIIDQKQRVWPSLEAEDKKMSPDAKAACNAAITPVSKIASNPSMLGSIKVLFWSRAQMAVATGSWDFKLAALISSCCPGVSHNSLPKECHIKSTRNKCNIGHAF